jgi:hypothetical protein
MIETKVNFANREAGVEGSYYTRTRGGATLPGGEGAWGAYSDDWRESLALCILC